MDKNAVYSELKNVANSLVAGSPPSERERVLGYVCKAVYDIVQRSQPPSGPLDLHMVMKDGGTMIAIVDAGSELDPFTGPKADAAVRALCEAKEGLYGIPSEVCVRVDSKPRLLGLYLDAEGYFASFGGVDAFVRDYPLGRHEQEMVDGIFETELTFLELRIGHQKRWENGKRIGEFEPDAAFEDEIL